MFWRGFRQAGRFLRPLIAFAWPWFVLWVSIETWMWALASRGSDAALPALLITIVVLARPLYQALWPGKAWQAIGIVIGVAGFCFGVSTWLAPHFAAEGLHQAIHTPSGDEQYAKAIVEKQLLVWFYPEMALLIVIAVVSAIIALSRLGPTIQVLRSIGQRMREYRRYGCCQPDLRELNRLFARCLTQLACAVFLALGVSEVAISFNELVDHGSFRDSTMMTNPSGAHIFADGALFQNNAPLKYYMDSSVAVPANELVCSNFGRYDLIHKIGAGRVDVIPRPMVQTGPSSWETRRQQTLQDVVCVPGAPG